jgi:hypothetical protein
VSDIVDQPPQFRAKRARVERQIARQIRGPLHIERRLTRRGRRRAQSCASETGIEQPSRDARGPAAAKRSGQLAQPRVELLCLALQREPVAARFELFQKRLQGWRHRGPGSMVGGLLDLRRAANDAIRREQAGHKKPLRSKRSPPGHRQYSIAAGRPIRTT